MSLLSGNHKLILVLLVFSALLVPSVSRTTVGASSSVYVNLGMEKQQYKVGDWVRVNGNVSVDGGLAYDALVAVQVDFGYTAVVILRTVQTGPITNPTWQVNVTALYACDANGNPVSSFQRGRTGHATLKWRNNGGNPAYLVPALYIQYSSGAPAVAIFPAGETPSLISPYTERTIIESFPISSTAPYGVTTIFASLYTAKPKDNGYPVCPEKNATFYIGTPTPTPPPVTQTPPNFNVQFSLDMAPPGGYNVYAATGYGGSGVSGMIGFGALPNPVQPRAFFINTPPQVGVNLTTTFDGSPSMPGGFNDTITRYEWNFGDGTPKVVKNGTYSNPPSPTADHTFTQNQTYTVSLNVTDNEGLWNTTARQVVVNLLIAPIADFTWSPQAPLNGTLITFDAGVSQLGWNGTAHPPIVNYYWVFGDGNTATVSTSTTTHSYQNPGNYSVQLTVTDAGGLHGSASKNVTVKAPPLAGSPDLDGNGRVDMGDINQVLNAFGSYPGKPNWDPVCDIDRNNRVDMGDVDTVLVHFGEYV